VGEEKTLDPFEVFLDEPVRQGHGVNGDLLQDHGKAKGIDLCELKENPFLDQGRDIGSETGQARFRRIEI